MKLQLNKEDLLLAVQSYVCEVVGEDVLVRSIEFANSKGDKHLAVSKLEIDFVKEKAK
jgi:hypothetical protein